MFNQITNQFFFILKKNIIKKLQVGIFFKRMYCCNKLKSTQKRKGIQIDNWVSVEIILLI